jgi:hypothetical protein
MNCPRCDVDVSDTYESDDFETGINAGYYCQDCDLGIGEDGDAFFEPMSRIEKEMRQAAKDNSNG